MNFHQVESLDIKDFNILFSSEQKLELRDGFSVDTDARGGSPYDAGPSLNEGLGEVNQSNFAALDAEFASQACQCKMADEIQKKEIVSSTRPVKNTGTFPESD